MTSMFEEVTMEQAQRMATAKARHYEFIEKMAAIMKEYEVEITGGMEGEVTIWTHFEGESEFTESYRTCFTAEQMAGEMQYKEWNTPTAEHIFNNHQRWAAEARARKANQ